MSEYYRTARVDGILDSALPQEELRRAGIWLKKGDIRLRVAVESGGEHRAYRYQPHISFGPLMASMHISEKIISGQEPNHRNILKEMKLEMLLALQEKIEEIVIEKMMSVASERKTYPFPSLWIPQKQGFVQCLMKLFVSRHIKREEVLVITDPKSYFHFMELVNSGENPEAIIGKIKWLTTKGVIQ